MHLNILAAWVLLQLCLEVHMDIQQLQGQLTGGKATTDVSICYCIYACARMHVLFAADKSCRGM